MMNLTNKKSETGGIAVIYCRVSNVKQTTRGDGLGSQETRCREYAGYKGYRVEQVFTDDMSGGVADRPGMMEMLDWLKEHHAENRRCVASRTGAGRAYSIENGNRWRGRPVGKPFDRIWGGLRFGAGGKPSGLGVATPKTKERRANHEPYARSGHERLLGVCSA